MSDVDGVHAMMACSDVMVCILLSCEVTCLLAWWCWRGVCVIAGLVCNWCVLVLLLCTYVCMYIGAGVVVIVFVVGGGDVNSRLYC